MHKYETNLASEFYVLAALYRRGADAALSLGNKKAIDITILHESGNTSTVDVKGVAGKHDWPADNIPDEAPSNHFVVFVSFEGHFDRPEVVPSIWVVPHAEVQRFRKQFKGRSNISRKKLVDEGRDFRDNWDLLLQKQIRNDDKMKPLPNAEVLP